MASAKDLTNLTDRVAIITGGAGFLGREFGRTLAEAGARVVVADVNQEAAETFARSLAATRQTQILPVQTDVTNRESVRAMVSSV